MAMDAVTKANLKQFADSQQIATTDTDKRFEYLAAYCVLSSALEDSLELESVVLGDGGDCGIDALAVVVNGVHVTDPQQVNDILENNKYLDAQFVFIQSTISSEFDSAKINSFFFGVEDFFRDTPQLPANDKMNVAREIKSALYERAANFKRGNPDIFCSYVTTGNWQEPVHTKSVIDAFTHRLASTNMLDAVKVDMIDARELQRMYRSTQNSLKTDIDIPNVLTVPPIEGVDQSYLGYVSGSEYLKLITDEYGNIRKTVFYDNVRDFQGDNKVNTKIAATLSSPLKSEFVLKNNGVTVVAKSLTRTGNKFSLTDYQIVNGCQTSHVLFANSDDIDDSVAIPIKIIATKNDETTRGIIDSTNSQTEVSDEQLRSLSDFQRILEDHFNTHGDDHGLFYERRSKQYASIAGVEKTRIISIPYQIKAFSAMFLNDPHRAGRYFASLRKIHESELFQESDKPEVYYTAAFAAYRLEYLFRNNLLSAVYKPVRYHLLMLIRIQTAGTLDIAPFNSRHILTLCDKINTVMWDADAALKAFETASQFVDRAFSKAQKVIDRDVARGQESTDVILAAARESLRGDAT